MDDDAVGYRVVLNANAGSAEDDALVAVQRVLTGTGADVEVVRTGDQSEVVDALHDLPAGWLPVVCGGDGSLHAVVRALRNLDRLDLPVGLLPMGTGNDFAGAVGLPVDDPEAAAHRVTAGRPRPYDLLVDGDGDVCVNAVHVGIGADAAANAEGLKERLDQLAYPVAALLSGLGARARDCRVEVDGKVLVDADVLLAAVCNGPTFGGGTRMAPDADPADGYLDVVVVTADSLQARIGFGLDLQRAAHLDREDVHAARGTAVSIRMPQARHDVDGEVQDARDGARVWELVPAGWQLWA